MSRLRNPTGQGDEHSDLELEREALRRQRLEASRELETLKLTLAERVADVQARERELEQTLARVERREQEQEATGSRKQRLEAVRIELDRLWDLLRQRRSLEEFGLNPDGASERDADTVEGYEQ